MVHQALEADVIKRELELAEFDARCHYTTPSDAFSCPQAPAAPRQRRMDRLRLGCHLARPLLPEWLPPTTRWQATIRQVLFQALPGIAARICGACQTSPRHARAPWSAFAGIWQDARARR